MEPWLLIAIIVVYLVTLKVTYEAGFKQGRNGAVLRLLPPVEDNMTEFYGFLRTLPQTRPSGTPTPERGSDNTE